MQVGLVSVQIPPTINSGWVGLQDQKKQVINSNNFGAILIEKLKIKIKLKLIIKYKKAKQTSN